MHYCPRRRPSEAPRGCGFDYSPNNHEITVLLPNQHVTGLTNTQRSYTKDVLNLLLLCMPTEYVQTSILLQTA